MLPTATQTCVLIDTTEAEFNWLDRARQALGRVIYDHDPNAEDHAYVSTILGNREDRLLAERRGIGFAVDLATTRDSAEVALIWGDEDVNLALLVLLISAFMREFRRTDPIPVTYAVVSDEPTPGGYGGGAIVVWPHRWARVDAHASAATLCAQRDPQPITYDTEKSWP